VIVGRVRIYSIIDAKTRRRLATVELARHGTNHGWIPVQCKGPANAPVPKAIGNAVTAFLMHVNQDVDRREAA
jgi:putative NIF3 family GTP cyclohydrolase 1 type 2